MYSCKIKCCFYPQKHCMNKQQILQQLIPSQTPDRFSKLLCSTVYNKLEHYNKQVNVCSALCPNKLSKSHG